MDLISFEEQDLFMVIVNGWEPDCPVLDRVHLLAGRRLRAGDERAVMLGRILAANLGKHTGDHVQVYGQDFEVVGEFESFSVYENGAVFMLLDELQRQMDRPGEVTGYIVQSADNRPAAIAELRKKIEALDSGNRGDALCGVRQLDFANTNHANDVVVHVGLRHRHRRDWCHEHDGDECLRTARRNRHVAGDGLAEVANRADDRERGDVVVDRRHDRWASRLVSA